jgi:hypothetical protein
MMMHTSILEREELRIFEDLISRFDSLTEVQMMSTVGVTPEWSAKDLLAHLAYWERAAAERVRESKLDGRQQESVRAPRGSASTVRLFQRIGPPHGRCFARN